MPLLKSGQGVISFLVDSVCKDGSLTVYKNMMAKILTVVSLNFWLICSTWRNLGNRCHF
jgi:hypothetical protein